MEIFRSRSFHCSRQASSRVLLPLDQSFVVLRLPLSMRAWKLTSSHSIIASWALLDETYHTPSFISSRSPFLLLSICMITSRYLPALDIYATLLVRVVEGASSYIIKGDRSIESVQAYLLLAMYLVQAPDHSDQSWLYICHASR